MGAAVLFGFVCPRPDPAPGNELPGYVIAKLS